MEKEKRLPSDSLQLPRSLWPLRLTGARPLRPGDQIPAHGRVASGTARISGA